MGSLEVLGDPRTLQTETEERFGSLKRVVWVSFGVDLPPELAFMVKNQEGAPPPSSDRSLTQSLIPPTFNLQERREVQGPHEGFKPVTFWSEVDRCTPAPQSPRRPLTQNLKQT